MYSESDNITVWRCRAQKCKCRLTTSNIDLRIVSIRNNHCHQPKNARPPPSISITVSDESEWTTYISRKETKCLRIENFCYYQISTDTSKNTIQWRCSHRGCCASAKSTVDLKHLSLQKKTHNHKPMSDDYFRSTQIRCEIKRRVSLDPSERPQKAVDLVIKRVPDDTLDGQDLKRFVATAKRKKRSKKPKIPKSSKDVEQSLRSILEKEITVEGGELVREIRKEVVMIGSDKGLKLLRENEKHIFGDGTFKYAPTHYKQMFTLHIIKDFIYVPVCYFLLRNKQQSTYETMFRMVSDMCPGFSPKVAHFDFEIAIHNGFRKVFPGAEVRGCRFHIAQAWYRKLASLGLQATYLVGKSRTAVWLKTCFGLPCLPPEDVLEFFSSDLKNDRPGNPSLITFCDYLHSTYLSPAAKFPPKLWAGCLRGDFNNTTNGCENFHRHFGAGFISPHPSIYDWLSHVSQTNKRHMIRSHGCRNPKNKSASINAHLTSLDHQRQSGQIDNMTFVKLVSLNCLPKSLKMCKTRSRSIVTSIKRKYARTVSRILKKR